jgi:hypothetical protein
MADSFPLLLGTVNAVIGIQKDKGAVCHPIQLKRDNKIRFNQKLITKSFISVAYDRFTGCSDPQGRRRFFVLKWRPGLTNP